MSTTAPKPPTATYTVLLGVLSTITAPLVALRVLVAMGVMAIADQTTNAATSIATVLAMSSAFGIGWRRSVLRSRAERANLIQRIDVLETRTENTARNNTTTVHYLPPRTHQPYRALVNGGEGDPTPTTTGVDPDTAAALRRINLRLRRVNDN